MLPISLTWSGRKKFAPVIDQVHMYECQRSLGRVMPAQFGGLARTRIRRRRLQRDQVHLFPWIKGQSRAECSSTKRASVTRSSVARQSRLRALKVRITMMNMLAITMPSGRSITLSTSVNREHGTNNPEITAITHQSPPALGFGSRLTPECQGNGDGGRKHQDKNSGGVGPRLSLDGRLENDRNGRINPEQDQDQGTGMGHPSRRHAEARQISGDQIQQPGHS